MPAERVHALRQRLQHLERGRAGLRQVEPNPAYAEAVQPLQLGIGYRGVHDRDPAEVRPQCSDAFKCRAIVDAVQRGLDDDAARGADTRLQCAIIGRRGVGRRQAARCRRKAAVIDVEMAVGGVRRRAELRCFGPEGVADGTLGSGRPCRCADRHAGGEGCRDGQQISPALQRMAHVFLPVAVFGGWFG